MLDFFLKLDVFRDTATRSWGFFYTADEMSTSYQNEDGLAAAKRQVDEVQGIMASNVEKVLEREGKLSHLEERADKLHEGTEQFHKAAVRIKKKHFWENMKMKIIIGVIIALIIIAIIIAASSN